MQAASQPHVTSDEVGIMDWGQWLKVHGFGFAMCFVTVWGCEGYVRFRVQVQRAADCDSHGCLSFAFGDDKTPVL